MSKASTEDTVGENGSTSSNSHSKQKSNPKKRSLKDLHDNDSDDEDLHQPESAPKKKRKLNNNEAKSEDEDSAQQDKDKSSSAPKAAPFKICCYNLNGVRAAAKKGLEEYLEEEDADIVCFSEMKAKLSQNPCKFRGYEIIWYECTEKAGYAGTAILSKIKPLNIYKGIGCEDGQGRAITLEYESFYLINTYVPNSGQNLKFKKRRIAWDKAMKKWISDLQKKKPIIWTGDLNVAILDFDVYDGETNKKREKTAGFTPYERENFRNLCDELSLVDSYRHFYPNERSSHYTFFSARARGHNMKQENKGWRLDYFMVSKNLINIIDDVEIRNSKSCSDHVPLILLMKDPDVALS